MLAIFIATLSLSITFVAFAQQVEYAWWITARFEPSEATIELIPVRDIDPTWATASPIRDRALPAKASDPGETLKEHEARLSMEGDFGRDGRPDKMLVGVYRTTSGRTGEFLLVLTKNLQAVWMKRGLFKHEGKPGFSAIIERDGKLFWVPCFECDYGAEMIVPSRQTWKLRDEGGRTPRTPRTDQ